MKYAINIKCPTCGAIISQGQEVCEYCGNPIIIVEKQSNPTYTGKFFNSVNTNENSNTDNNDSSKALFYLGLKKYEQAYSELNKNIEENVGNSDSYFLLSICMVGDKKPFELLRPKINEILDNLNTAIAIEKKPIYYYFKSLILYDYFKRKHLKTEETYLDVLNTAYELGLTKDDIDSFHNDFGFENIRIEGVS